VSLFGFLGMPKQYSALAKDLQEEEGTNYDTVDNKYDAMRHIASTIEMYGEYPDFFMDVPLYLNEVFTVDGLEPRLNDIHNNEIGKAIASDFTEEEIEMMSPEEIFGIAQKYVEDSIDPVFSTAIDPDLMPRFIYGDTKK
jgi:hypothetical protein